MTPTVSVVTCAYQCGSGDQRRWLREAIESVAKQNAGPIEFVGVDDGSDDDTHHAIAVLLHSFRDRFDRVVTVRLAENVGPGAAANAGIECTRGDYIARIDADDVWLPGKLRAQLDYLDANPECVALGTMCHLGGAVLQPGLSIDWPTGHDAIDAALDTCLPMLHSSLVFRRGAIETVGGYNPALRFAEDHDIISRLANLPGNARLANLPDVYTLYRQHETQATQNIKPEDAEAKLAVMARHAARRRSRHASPLGMS